MNSLPIATESNSPEPDLPALKNRFRDRDREMVPIRPFEEAKEKLPVPILPESLAQHAAWERMYWRAWELAWSNLHQPAEGTGFVSNYIRPPTHDHIYMWDSAFSALYGIYGRHGFDFMGTLNNFYAWQHPDGFIRRKMNDRTGGDLANPFDPDSSGPNILAWAEWRYFRATGDEERLRQVYYPLVALYQWFQRNRTWRDGLYWATGTSSGMNNQNRIPDSRHFHSHHVWVDVTIQAAINAMALQQMALAVGKAEDAEMFGRDRANLREKINRMLWNDEAGFYHDLDQTGGFVPDKTIAAYWALQDKELVPPENLERFLEHLSHEERFNTPHPLPTLSADSPNFQANGGGWRGAVWPATNYMVLNGLRQIGRGGLAHRLALKHLDYVSQLFDRTGAFWENYAPLSPEPGDQARQNVIGWAGMSPIAILLEDVLGIWADWPTRRVFWERRIRSAEHYGVQNYPLGPCHTVDILGDQEMVFITTDVPFTFVLRTPEIKLQTAIPVGTTTIPLK